MAQVTPEGRRLLEQALSLSVEEQEALADSLISNLRGSAGEGVQQTSEAAERLATFGRRHRLSLRGLEIKSLINAGRR
jgi:DNA-binding transcriptional LysR family regulator